MRHFVFFLIVMTLICCGNDSIVDVPIASTTLYFPPLHSNEWERTTPEALGWNTAAIPDLLTFLENNQTRAFIILKDGKIVLETYHGTNILGTAAFDEHTLWYWASAGKTLTAALVGIAQQEGLIDINKPTSNYLGDGWTDLTLQKEQLITVKHQLTMTTGLDYNTSNLDCTLPSCLTYKADAGQQWYYHNAPYTLLEKVVENATSTDYNQYTNNKIESRIGMSGQWISQGYNNVYWSTARDMARFGLLILNKGSWNQTQIIADDSYIEQMLASSQTINPAYGYLWWLNGHSSIIYPGFTNSFNTALSPNAPNDLVAGLGKNGQFVEVIPSLNMVVIRMGEAPDNALVPILFHDQMWEKINAVLD